MSRLYIITLLMQSTSWETLDWKKHKLESRLPGESQGRGSLVGCCLWGRTESDTTERLNWTELMELDDMILVFWMLPLKPTFSPSSYTFIKRLFSSSLSAISVVSSAYEVIDISPGNLDSSCCFFQPAFLMMYSVYKLNKQGDNIQPWCIPFPIWN